MVRLLGDSLLVVEAALKFLAIGVGFIVNTNQQAIVHHTAIFPMISKFNEILDINIHPKERKRGGTRGPRGIPSPS